MNLKPNYGALTALIVAIIIATAASQTRAAEIVRPGTDYSAARKLLLSSGFAPLQFSKQRCLNNVSGRNAICEAYPETAFCSGTGLANCQFVFRGSKGELLLVETQGEEQEKAGHDIGLDLGVKRTRPATATERTRLLADVEDKQTPKGFIFRSQDISHATNRGQSVRFGEKISPQVLKRRFAGYQVRFMKGDDCFICTSISGVDGSFEVSLARDGRTVIGIRSSDKRSRDAYGNSVGSSLAKAVGSSSARCDAGVHTTCESPSLNGLSYIVAGNDHCPIVVKESLAPEIPACARVAGFQIHASESSARSQNGYTLICKNRILQTSETGLKLSKLTSPVSFNVRFTEDETTWIDPRDKSETVFENLLLTQGDRVSYGGQVKGSTFDSSTTFDGSFKSSGKGTINWGYAKSLRAFTVTTGAQTYLCEKTDGK